MFRHSGENSRICSGLWKMHIKKYAFHRFSAHMCEPLLTMEERGAIINTQLDRMPNQSISPPTAMSRAVKHTFPGDYSIFRVRRT